MWGRTSGKENFVWETSYEINCKINFFFGYGCTGVNLTKLSLGIVADFGMLKFRRLSDDNQKNIRTISFYFRQTNFLNSFFLSCGQADGDEVWLKHFPDL